MIRLEPLATQGADAIDALLDAAFGADRRGRTAYAIRRGMAWLTDLSYAAIDDATGVMAGLLQSWPVALHGSGDSQAPLVMVGPVAVLPDRQGEGIGRALMDRLVADADRIGCDPLMMIGDADYYGRFWGFSAAATGQWEVPGPVERARLLARPAGAQDQRLPGAGLLGPRRVAVRSGRG
ncbi:MAG TPA: N-acetyltransferase [Sphingobium sp.]|nr:N-acetyltransferase [Sphingobium sp.]